MAKSRIIKELANGSIDTLTALKRAKVLLSELKDDELLFWINNEIEGYPPEVSVPDYRKCIGGLMGSYTLGVFSKFISYKNVTIPLGNMSDEDKEKILCIELREGIDSLRELYENSKSHDFQLGKTIPADLYPYLVKCNNNPFMNISYATVKLSPVEIYNIFSIVENKLIDILLLLEKKFGTLDDLDIDVSTSEDNEIKDIIEHIKCIVYNDNSITIGDNNKMKDMSITISEDDE